MGGIDGKRFLTAMVATYEIFIRLSEASNMRTLGWDQGFAVALSATAGICNLLGLTVEQTANAIGDAAKNDGGGGGMMGAGLGAGLGSKCLIIRQNA